MPTEPEEQGVSLVILGEINPAVFQPYWFAQYGLIRDMEASSAQVNVIHRDVASFETDWMQFQATQSRLSLHTKQEPFYEPLRDLLHGILDLLPHTPVTALGINRYFHVQCASMDAWHAIGDALAPKGPWSAMLHSPGLRQLVMEGGRDDDRPGYVQVIVGPSKSYSPGVFIEHNDHYALDKRGADAASAAQEILLGNFTQSLMLGVSAAEAIVSLGGVDAS